MSIRLPLEEPTHEVIVQIKLRSEPLIHCYSLGSKYEVLLEKHTVYQPRRCLTNTRQFLRLHPIQSIPIGADRPQGAELT